MTKLETQAKLNKQCIEQHEDRIDAMEDHITIANKEMGELRDGINKVDVKVEKVSADVDWLKKTYWLIFSASLGALITGLVNLLGKI